ncbi:hypothetical protein LPJ56_003062 [Coemansia sp. RSA 2599]|nr:hypothetical protein LPJ56_003062 [Coemansia sp. RSA 2599]
MQRQQLNVGSHSATENGVFSGSVKMKPNDGGIHSAPAHVSSSDANHQLGNLGRYADDDHRRNGAVSAGPFGPHRNFLFESFSPSVFSRPVGTMTPTDQLDALALEGRVNSGYSTPTQSTRRRHSVQADINEVIAAAAADAAGLDRSGFPSTLQFFHTGVAAGLGHASAANIGSGAMQLNSADAIRRMTIGGTGAIGNDPYLFPRLPEDDASAAAAAAAAAAVAAAASVADISAHISSAQTTAGTPASDGSQSSQIAASAALNMTSAVGMGAGFKMPAPGSVDPGLPTSAPLVSSSSVGDLKLLDQSGAGQRGQLRSAQRLLRANGVADDNSIGLSTNQSGDGSRAELEAFSQLSQWFPNFASSGLGWSIGDSNDQLTSESIDPNMLDAGLASAAMVGAAAGGAVGGGLGDGNGTDGGSAVASGMAPNGESTLTHSRRRSQFDWYGLTPSLLAQLEAASVSSAVQAAAAVAATPDTNAMGSLNPFGISHGSVNQTYRRPSMPIFPTFAYSSSDMLALSGNGMQSQGQTHQAGDGPGLEQSMYAAASQDAAAGMVPMNIVDNSGGASDASGASGFIAGDAASGLASNKPSLSGIASSVLSAGAVRPRVASGQGQSRRRTMHVPPSLIEDVATAEFSSGEASMPTRNAGPAIGRGQQQQHQQGGWRNGSAYPPRPVSSRNVATRVRRSRTIGSNQNAIQAVISQGMLGNIAQQSQAQPQPGMPSSSSSPSSMLPTVSESVSASPIRFPQLPSQHSDSGGQNQTLPVQQPQPQQQQQQGRQQMAFGAAPTGARHSRSFSGTQFPQDAIGSIVGLPGGLMPAVVDSTVAGLGPGTGVGAGNNSNSMDIDLEAMAPLSASGSAPIDLSSFKPSLWASSALFADDGSQLGMHDETRSLVDIRSAGGSSVGNREPGGFVDLYRPASSTPTGYSSRGALGMSGAAMASGDGIIGSARNPSPMLGAQNQAPTADMSPVAPRSAASTPGRREAVGI